MVKIVQQKKMINVYQGGAGETMNGRRSTSAAEIHIIVSVVLLIFVCREMDLGVM
jgi:hypothetical protein